LKEYERVEKDDRGHGMKRLIASLEQRKGSLPLDQDPVSVSPISEKGIRYYYTSYFSIDEQKKVEADLLGSQATLKEALSNSAISNISPISRKST
jgi:hypothetical protein